MKRVLFLVIAFIVSVSLVNPVGAQTLKVGVVDLLKVLNDSEAGKKSILEIETSKKNKQTTIEEKGKKIEQLKADLEKQSSLLSAEAKKSREEEIERLIREFQRLVTDATAELQKKQREVEVEMIKEIRQILTKIGETDKYSLIIESSEGGLLYFDKTVDITDKVISKYNETKKK
ncbi:MAG TPA: OmpH family outer membrane protein [Nitrospirae bacterium]|nr:OmpH family outer membrane protein [Nitrospirota bacterium]